LDLYVLVSWMIVAGGLADREALTTFWCHAMDYVTVKNAPEGETCSKIPI
jgi:hypothetical protein